MTKARLDILVVSDLHAHSGDPRKGDAPSYYSTNSLYSAADLNPLTGIATLIGKAGVDVDWIVCPGDLGDKADPAAQKIAWEQLEKLRIALGATHLLGATGNHDVDSRRLLPEFDPKSALQLLIPTFPIDAPCFQHNDRVYADRFWSNNFVLVPFPEISCSLLLINSCAFHGFASDVKKKTKAEHLNGKLSPLTLAAIKAATASLATKLNIALVHHHPVKIPFVDDGNSMMVGGDILIDHLKSTDKQWLIIHGHAHAPNLAYADASQTAPVVLSAGSVAAKTARVKGGYARNQIHHISISLDRIEHSGTQLFGRITSWSWAFENGWVKSSGTGVLPYSTGFGYKFDLVQTRDNIVVMAKARAPELLSWNDVLQAVPKLVFLAPDDHIALLKSLSTAGVKIEKDEFGIPVKLEWQI
jgi:hypothetical protein